MLISNHGVLRLLVTCCALVAVTLSDANSKEWESGIPPQDSSNRTDGRKSDLHVQKSKSVADMVKSHRRAPRYDTAASTGSYVRVFNRPPGTGESFYKYETRANTSAHTSGEIWDTYLDDLSEDNIDRSDVNVKDILRVKPKSKAAAPDAPKIKAATESPASTKSTLPTTVPDQAVAAYPAPKKDNQKKGYIVWSSGDGSSKPSFSSDVSASKDDEKPQSAVEEVSPRDGSHWKVVGDGGEEGWQVLDDKGEVEWKIEYDDGEWRVISNSDDLPGEGEWVDPDYIWGPPEGSTADNQEYNAWPADDYKAPPNWTGQETYYGGTANGSWSQSDRDQKKTDQNDQVTRQGWKSNSPSSSASLNNQNEKLKFGVRRKVPDSSKVEERTNAEASIENTSDDASLEDRPQNDQIIFTGKTWMPENPAVKSGQKWVQSYGSKTWQGDNTGFNVETNGETWIAKKNFASDPWIPKVPGATSTTPATRLTDENNRSTQDNSVRAWGTGYGSKTWKGDEWDSNVVWKTGFNSGLPWAEQENSSTTWQFPETTGKKPEVWSQPIPSNVETAGVKNTPPPSKRQDRVRVKWPVKPANRGDAYRKSQPDGAPDSESWSDDDSVGGVIWRQGEDEDMVVPTDEMTPMNKGKSWQGGQWKVSTPNTDQTTAAPAKNGKPPKSSNLISVGWKAGGQNPLDLAAVPWNQGQWPVANIEPTWLFQGCKMTLKCGSVDETKNDDSNENMPDMPDDDSRMTTTAAPVNVVKGWPPRPNGGKSWRPPTKSWKPPKWKRPTKAPPTAPETMSPVMMWKPPPTPKVSWKKPTPPPDMWKQPPSTMMWTETTPSPPDMTWKPPPPPMKWKKGPRPTKSWKPPPTKSWKPPKQPWQPSIATPPPDVWPATKPDCKDPTDTTQPPQQPETGDDDDLMEPPQIIIITKLPKGSAPAPKDKKDPEDSSRKPPSGPWVFPPRKYVPKTSKNRKDKNIPIGGSKKQMNRPNKKNSRPPNMTKGWPKSMTPPKFGWPDKAMRRWTTKMPPNFAAWKSKYSKSRTWRQMLKKWINGW